MTLLEGSSAAEDIKKELANEIAAINFRPRLGIVIVGKNPVSLKFVELKEKYAREVGADTRRYEFPDDISTNELRARMKDIVHEPENRGILIQLPLPTHIDTQAILNTVIPEKDVDVLSARAVGDFQVGKAKVMPPVAGALEVLFQKYDISTKGKKAVVIGYGRLVGQPIATWLLREGALVTVMKDSEQFDVSLLKDADIIVSGAGRPRLIIGDMIKPGAAVVDVGTSEMNGEVVGDVDFESVSKVAGFLTPTKGGVGPLTVAMVFQNLLTLTQLK